MIYLSQLLPRNFDLHKRARLLDILLHPCTPFVPAYIHGNSYTGACEFGSRVARHGVNHANSNLTSKHLRRTFPSPSPLSKRPLVALPSVSRWTWPKTELPVEIFELIASFLPREDIQSMRLVSRHFEKNISLPMFRTVVVPFRSELQDLMLGSKGFGNNSKDESKRVAEKENVGILNQHIVTEPLSKGLLVQSVSPENMDRGMRVFQGWGPHIRRIAMAFELNEGECYCFPPQNICSSNYPPTLPSISAYQPSSLDSSVCAILLTLYR